MAALYRLLKTEAPAASILIRLIVGAVFLSEGIQKFLFPNEVGTGRFARIVIPKAEVMAPFVGIVEITCGALIMLGLLTRVATIPLIINMLVAIVSTKVPILRGMGSGVSDYAICLTMASGEWPMKHEQILRCSWARFFFSSSVLEPGLLTRA